MSEVPRQDRLGASTFMEKGWSLIASGDPERAIAALQEARRLAPDDVDAAALLGWAETLTGRHDDALQTLTGVLARDPAHAMARVNLGYICLRRGVFGEAIEHLTRVIHEQRDRKAVLYAHHYLGLVYLERGMADDAAGFLREAVALGPNLIEARYDLGRALALAGRPAEALAVWREGAAVGAYSPWALRCVEAVARVEAGEEPPSSPG